MEQFQVYIAYLVIGVSCSTIFIHVIFSLKLYEIFVNYLNVFIFSKPELGDSQGV